MLTDLNLSKNNISKIENYSLTNLSSLIILDLHQNKLKFFDSVPKSTQLDAIILAFNFITDLANLHDAPNLTILDLHNNKLEEVPESVLSMNNLKTLNISNNNMNNLPPRIALLDNLVRIQIEGNPLKSIKSSMRAAKADHLKEYLRLRLDTKEEEEYEIKKAQDAHLPGVSSTVDQWDIYIREFLHNNQLVMQRKDISTISDILWDYDEITMLDLTHNNLKSLPEDIWKLSRLVSLRLGFNKLESLPETLTQISSLKELELSDNNLGGFYSEGSVFRMDSLTYLNLSNNGIKSVPTTLKNLKNLNTLYLSHNHITDIKEICRGEFYKLQVLDVSNNKITELPRALAYFLEDLNFLNVVNNEISRLPHNLGLHKSIKNLQVDGNPLKSIRRTIIDRGTAGLLQYLADKYNDEVDSGIEEWAIPKKGKKKNREEPISKYEEDKQFEEAKIPSVDAKVMKRNERGYEDNISQMSFDKVADPHHKGFGVASTNMYSELGSAQQDDFFWKNHQQQKPYSHHPAEETYSQSVPVAPVQPQIDSKADVQSINSEYSTKSKLDMATEIKTLDEEIRQLIDAIDNDFSLSKRDIQVKRKELHKVQARRNKLINELAE